MWYCSVGKARVLIASTFLGVEILLDQIVALAGQSFLIYQVIYNGCQCLVYF